MVLAALVFAAVAAFFAALFAGLAIHAAGGDWPAVFADPEFRFAVGFTLATSLAATALACSAALGCAVFLARVRFPGRVVLDTLLDLPLVLPPLVSGVALLIFFGPVLGPWLSRFGAAVVFTPLGAVVAQAFVAFPFALKLFREAVEAIDPRFENVARTLGCTPARAFYHVTLPMMRRALVAGAAMTWARAVGEFGATAMLAGVTRMRTETLSAAIYLSISVGDLPFALVVSTMLLAASLTVLVLFKLLAGGADHAVV